jgi:DNA-binding NarL/FixJ family response regulator
MRATELYAAELDFENTPDQRLSPRQQEIVKLVVQARADKEIAFLLQLAEGTVRQYLSRLYRKLGLKNRTELAVWAVNRPGR